MFSLPSPLFYCVFDCFVLLHKIPNICRFYAYFSMLFRLSVRFVLLTVRPLKQTTRDARRKTNREWVGNRFHVRISIFGSWQLRSAQIMQIWNSNKVDDDKWPSSRMSRFLAEFSRIQFSFCVQQSVSLLVEYVVLIEFSIFEWSEYNKGKVRTWTPT